MEIRLPLAVGVVMALAYGGFTGTRDEDIRSPCGPAGVAGSRLAAAVDPVDVLAGGHGCRLRGERRAAAPLLDGDDLRGPGADVAPTADDLLRGSDVTPVDGPDSPDPDEFEPPHRNLDEATDDRPDEHRRTQDRIGQDSVGDPTTDVSDETPVDQAPVDQAPVYQAPVDQAPVDQAPADETPADETPADEAPVDGEPAVTDPGAGDAGSGAPTPENPEIPAGTGGPLSTDPVGGLPPVEAPTDESALEPAPATPDPSEQVEASAPEERTAAP